MLLGGLLAAGSGLIRRGATGPSRAPADAASATATLADTAAATVQFAWVGRLRCLLARTIWVKSAASSSRGCRRLVVIMLLLLSQVLL